MILTMDKGKISEFDTPAALLDDPTSRLNVLLDALAPDQPERATEAPAPRQETGYRDGGGRGKYAYGVLLDAARPLARAQDARDTSPNSLSDQGRHSPTAPSPPTDSIQGKSDPTGRRHLQGMPVPGAPEDTYLRPQDTYPHHRIPTPPLSGGIRGMGQPPCTWRSAPGPLAVRCQRHSDNHTPNHTGRVILRPHRLVGKLPHAGPRLN